MKCARTSQHDEQGPEGSRRGLLRTCESFKDIAKGLGDHGVQVSKVSRAVLVDTLRAVAASERCIFGRHYTVSVSIVSLFKIYLLAVADGTGKSGKLCSVARGQAE